MKTGSCLCGAVQYEFDEPARPVHVCHCTQCRKQSGSFVHATSVPNSQFRFVKSDSLTWYRASEWAQRGFCGTCGSNLFWRPDSEERISFSAGSIDGPTGLAIEGHIFCAYKGDYYEISQNEGYQRQEWEA
jgi:hypothetical protein